MAARGAFVGAPHMGPHAMAMLIANQGPLAEASGETSGGGVGNAQPGRQHGGLRRDLTHEHEVRACDDEGSNGERRHGFQELRRMYRENDETIGGPRREWLAAILNDQDTKSLVRFMETARAPQQQDKGCAWCNDRIHIDQQVRASKVGDHRGSYSPGPINALDMLGGHFAFDLGPSVPATPSKTVKPKEPGGALRGACCKVCLKWHCEKCCGTVDVAALLPKPRGVGVRRQQDLAAIMQCCPKCQRLFEVVRWRREEAGLRDLLQKVYELRPPSRQMSPRERRESVVQAPDGLNTTSRQLLTAHGNVGKRLTAAAAALAQVDGLARSVELQRRAGLAMADELLEEMQSSQSKASSCLGSVEAALRSIEQIPTNGPNCPRNDQRLKIALIQYVNNVLEDLKPRVGAAIARADRQSDAAKQSSID